MDYKKYRRDCSIFADFLGNGRGGLYIGENTTLCGNVCGQQILSDVRHTQSLKISFLPSASEIGAMSALYYFIKGGMVVADINAGCGFYSIFLASLVGPSGKIYSFEPLPECCELIIKNAQMNDIHCIEYVNKAVSDGIKNIKKSYFDVNYTFSFSPEAGYDQKNIDVISISLDDYLKAAGEPFLDFIIINNAADLLEIWKGMADTLRASPEIKIICTIDQKALSHSPAALSEVLHHFENEQFKAFLLPSLKPIEKKELSSQRSKKTVLLSRQPL